MAKGNLFLGQAKGKVGSVVFARAFGQQITRTKPTAVRNPKTIGQNTQRAILATIAKEAALLTPIVDHSFANVAYGAESVRHFRKVNMGVLRNLLLTSLGTNYNLSAKGANAVPNYLKISEGNLPAFAMSSDDDAVAFYMNENNPLSLEEVTVKEFKEAYPNIQGGDQITLVKIVKTSGSLIDGDAIFALKVDRMVFAPNAFEDQTQTIMEDGEFNQVFFDMTKTTNLSMLGLADGGAGNALGFSTDADNTYAAALILSRKVDGKWQRSTQFIELCEFDDYTNNEAAIDSYGASASLNEDTEYLNQADESVIASGVNDAYMAVSIKVGDDAKRTSEVNAGSVDSETITEAANTKVAIDAHAYAPSGKRVVAVEIDRPDGSYAAHGASYLNYNVRINAGTAGQWKVIALFDDGTNAEYHITLAVQN